MDDLCWKNQKSTKRKDKRLYYINLESGISQWGIPANNMFLPAGWEMHLSKTRNSPFYSNFKKKITQWDMPTEEDGNEVPEGWKEMRSSKCNSIYYKNTKTGEVQWIIPHSLSIKPVGIGIPKSFLSIVEDCTKNEIWKWKETDPIGSGKAGSVYIACKGIDDCDYVVKVQEENKEYYTEIEALLSLQYTNAVPKVFAAWTCDKFGYFVIEKLYPCIHHNNNSMWIAVGIKLDIIRKAGYLQVDIHNGNVMCNKQGQVVLIDFGYAVKRTEKKDKQKYPDHIVSEKYGIPLTWEYLEIIQETNYNTRLNPLMTQQQKDRNANIQKKYTDAKAKVEEKIRKQKEAFHPDDEGQNRLSPTISMEYFMIVTTRNNHNERLKKLYIKNYSHNKDFSPEHMYEMVMTSQDMWFHLVNNNDMIIGCCSVKIEDNKYIFDDVFIEEEFRGNNYAKLLLLYAMKSVRANNINASFQITAQDDYIPAVKTYSRIFGEPIRVENNMFIYSGITEDELEMQLANVPLVTLV
jgi:predicted GNAT family N-acyltransferase